MFDDATTSDPNPASDHPHVDLSDAGPRTISSALNAELQFGSSLKPLRNKFGPCASCNKEPIPGQRFSTCSSCKAVLYCSKECQRSDWSAHKYVSTHLSKHSGSCSFKTGVQEATVARSLRGVHAEHAATARQPISCPSHLLSAWDPHQGLLQGPRMGVQVGCKQCGVCDPARARNAVRPPS